MNLSLLASTNGLDFQLYPSSYTPTSGHVVRDPSIAKINGVWWIVHTNVSFAASTTFDLATSTDGVNYTYVTSVDCSAIVGNDSNSAVWAPEWFVDDDGSVHVFMALRGTGVTGTNFFIFETHPTNAGYTTWSTPTALSSTPAAIDPFMVKRNGTYYLWWKDTAERIQHSSSSSLLTGYTTDTTGDWAGFGTPKEGPALYQLPNGTWTILLDKDGHGIYYSTGTSDWSTWSAPVLLPPINGGKFVPQHGTVLHFQP